jgi:hypothetical protein
MFWRRCGPSIGPWGARGATWGGRYLEVGRRRVRGGPGTAVQPLKNSPSAQTNGGGTWDYVFGVSVALQSTRTVPQKAVKSASARHERDCIVHHELCHPLFAKEMRNGSLHA